MSDRSLIATGVDRAVPTYGDDVAGAAGDGVELAGDKLDDVADGTTGIFS